MPCCAVQTKLSDHDLLYLASAGRLLVARPYSKKLSHQEGLASCVAAAEVSRVSCKVIPLAALL